MLFLDLTGLPVWMQCGILTLGVFVGFMTSSVVEESLFRGRDKDVHLGWYMTFVELVCFASFAMAERNAKGEQVWQHKGKLTSHAYIALYMTLARGLTNMSLEYLNYPTQVIFKSLKLLTVMVASVFVLKKTYRMLEYMAAFFLVLSAILFNLGDVDVAPAYDTFGVTIVVISLVFDALHSTSQDSVTRKEGAGVLETMLYTNLFSAGGALVICFLNGDFLPAFRHCAAHPELYPKFVARSLFVYIGVVFFVTLIKNFGAVFATNVTTVRKILTVLMSFVIYPKPWSVKYVYGLLLFVIGLTCELTAKRQMLFGDESKSKEAADAPKVEMEDLEKQG